MAGRGTRKTAVAGFVVALTLSVAGLARHAALGTGPGLAGTRILFAGVRSMSWQTVIESMQADRLPELSRLARGVRAPGDIIGSGYESEAEVLASILTGRLPFKHGIRDFAQVALLRGDTDSGPRPAWELMSARGQRAAVIGLPFGRPPALRGAQAAGDRTTIAPMLRLYGDGHEIAPVRDQARLMISPDRVPTDLIRRVAGESVLPPSTILGLRRSLAADLSVTALAADLLRSSAETHVFLYLQGLHEWEVELRRLAAPESPVPDGAILLANYYEVLDGLLARLNRSASHDTVTLLYSERGNRMGPIDYRPHFPRLRRWPSVGFFMAWGAGIKRTVRPHSIAPPDLAATALYLSGTPIPNDLDGLILFELLHDDQFFKHRLSFSR